MQGGASFGSIISNSSRRYSSNKYYFLFTYPFFTSNRIKENNYITLVVAFIPLLYSPLFHHPTTTLVHPVSSRAKEQNFTNLVTSSPTYQLIDIFVIHSYYIFLLIILSMFVCLSFHTYTYNISMYQHKKTKYKGYMLS